MSHKPVLVQELLTWLQLKPGMVVVDGTVGAGGHTQAMLEAMGGQGRVIALDQDLQAIEQARRRFQEFPQVILQQTNFRFLQSVLETLNIEAVDAVVLDIGFSSTQLDDAERGFSFERKGPLDMRMDRNAGMTAKALIDALSAEELESIFRRYGEERWSRRIARRIVQARESQDIQSTEDLAEIVRQAVPYRGKINPATRVFQALRIAVNDELGALNEGLEQAWEALKPSGRCAVISFHSLEDRIVKNYFRKKQEEKKGNILTRKPVQAGEAEIVQNRRSRSAKLRVAEKIL